MGWQANEEGMAALAGLGVAAGAAVLPAAASAVERATTTPYQQRERELNRLYGSDKQLWPPEVREQLVRQAVTGR